MFRRLRDIWQAIKQFIRANDKRRDDDYQDGEAESDRRAFRSTIWNDGKRHDLN